MTPCAGWHPNDTPPPPGTPIWCETHTWEIRNQLRNLIDLYATLHTEARHATPKPGVRVSGTRNPRSPAPRIDDADELAHWACDWEDTIRHELHHPAAPTPASARPRALTTAIHYLTIHLAQALALNDATDEGTDEPLGLILGNEIHATHYQLLRKTYHDDLTHHLDPPCPACDLRALRRHDGEDHIHCANCYTTWTEPEYQHLVLVLTSAGA